MAVDTFLTYNSHRCITRSHAPTLPPFQNRQWRAGQASYSEGHHTEVSLLGGIRPKGSVVNMLLIKKSTH